MTGKSNDNGDTIVLEKHLFQNTLRPRKTAVCKFLRLEERFREKLRFRDELVWTVDQTVERKLRFQIPPAYM